MKASEMRSHPRNVLHVLLRLANCYCGEQQAYKLSFTCLKRVRYVNRVRLALFAPLYMSSSS